MNDVIIFIIGNESNPTIFRGEILWIFNVMWLTWREVSVKFRHSINGLLRNRPVHWLIKHGLWLSAMKKMKNHFGWSRALKAACYHSHLGLFKQVWNNTYGLSNYKPRQITINSMYKILIERLEIFSESADIIKFLGKQEYTSKYLLGKHCINYPKLLKYAYVNIKKYHYSSIWFAYPYVNERFYKLIFLINNDEFRKECAYLCDGYFETHEIKDIHLYRPELIPILHPKLAGPAYMYKRKNLL